jgi:hypothetical protein
MKKIIRIRNRRSRTRRSKEEERRKIIIGKWRIRR